MELSQAVTAYQTGRVVARVSEAEKEAVIFSEAFLLKRPLLQAITEHERAPVLLIDEIDRSDEEFEAFLLEVLSDFQVTIPEIGTIKATHRPHVVLTSNRSRDLSDALRRRCLYHWIDYPSLQKELEIVRAKVPAIGEALSQKVTRVMQATQNNESVEGSRRCGNAGLGHRAGCAGSDAVGRRNRDRDDGLFPERRG